MQAFYNYKVDLGINQYGCRHGHQAPEVVLVSRANMSVAKKNFVLVYCLKLAIVVVCGSVSHFAALSTLKECGAPEWLTRAALESSIKIEVKATIASTKGNEVHVCIEQRRGIRLGFVESGLLFVASVDAAFKGQITSWMDRYCGYLLNGHYEIRLLFCDELLFCSIDIFHLQIMARETQFLLHAIGLQINKFEIVSASNVAHLGSIGTSFAIEAQVFSFDCLLPGESPLRGDLQVDADHVECDVTTVNAAPENTMKFLGHKIDFEGDWIGAVVSQRIRCGYCYFFASKDIYFRAKSSVNKKRHFFRRTILLSAALMAEIWLPPMQH